MTTWLKNTNNKWYIPNNDVQFSEFKENLNTLSIDKSNGKSVIYIPTHNINDVFEWYRIFKDSYAYTDNYDKNGFGIHGYFNNNRGQSIKGWFPNLVEVKAASSNTKYNYFNNANYNRSSVDNITDFNQPNLYIDNVKIFDNENVLLKNQFTEQLTLYTINSILSTDAYYIQLNIEDQKYLKLNSTIIIKTSTDYIEDIIIGIEYVSILAVDYVKIYTKNNILSDFVSLGDIYNGLWTKTSNEITNGVYTYLNDQLDILSNMSDPEKVYNQIVYTYQGDTNSNKQYYLRRVEDTTSLNYSLYPIIGMNEPFYYSEGEAYLVKCEFDYTLSLEQNIDIVQSVIFSCVNCINNTSISANTVIHPTTPAPYSPDDNVFRLLYLDNDVANKVMSTDNNGIGSYVGDIIPFDFISDIQFKTTDIDNLDNLLNNYYDDIYYNSPFIIDNLFKFTYTTLPTNKALSIDFIDTDIIIDNNGSYTEITATYDIVKFPTSFDTTNINLIGSAVNLKFINDTDEIILDQQFLIATSTNAVSNIVLEVFPKFDTNFLNDLLTNGYTLTIEPINLYNDFEINFNKSILSTIYEFEFNNVLSLVILFTNLTFKSIRHNHKYKWTNHSCEIINDSISYYIKHTIDENYRKYFFNYNIKDYLTDYLGINTTQLEQLQNTTYTINNDITNINYFRILKNNKNPTQDTGNIIEFGITYKNDILLNIKNDTKINITVNAVVYNNIWVSKVSWDDDTQIGRIICLDLFDIGNNTEIVTVTNMSNLQLISDKLFEITNTILHTNNQIGYKIDTDSYAKALMNYGLDVLNVKNDEIIQNVSAILFKEYNEPKVTFFKRDRYFKFDNNKLYNSNVVISNTNINIAAVFPVTIDTHLLVAGDLVVLTNQTVPSENNVYLVGLTTLSIFQDINIGDYFKASVGTNIGKTVQSKLLSNSNLEFLNKSYGTKKDPRLTLKPIGIGKLGVDNLTKPFVEINKKYDTLELEENVLIIQKNINIINKIRFINGLTEYDILNNINGQGIYAWILAEDVIVENAVVGKDNAGRLIWYKGTWKQGVWCDGIWTQGLWENGIWVNGIHNSFPIIDNFYTVQIINTIDDTLSTWLTGDWYNGIWNNGVANNINWLDGIMNGGTIKDGTWANGVMNNGIIEYITWETGTLYGGQFKSGLWKNGTLNENTAIPAIFGNGATVSGSYKTRAIWLNGTFTNGTFHSGDNTRHNASIWYYGTFVSGNWYGGSFIMGTFGGNFYNGVWFGGYNCTIDPILTNLKNVEILPGQYDVILELSTIAIPYTNSSHKLNSGEQYELIAYPTTVTTFGQNAFINISDSQALTYIQKTPTPGLVTNTTIQLDISGTNIGLTYNVNGNPLICAKFNGSWYNGIWMNGLFDGGTFEQGIWLNGYFRSGIFGI